MSRRACLKTTVSWHETIVSCHDTTISCHDTTYFISLFNRLFFRLFYITLQTNNYFICFTYILNNQI